MLCFKSPGQGARPFTLLSGRRRIMKRHLAVSGLATFLLFVLGCAQGKSMEYHLVNQPGVKTLVNLHPDEAKMLLYSTNYQMPGTLIPRCSEVMIDSATDKRVTFT